jgi:hypothetical protein
MPGNKEKKTSQKAGNKTTNENVPARSKPNSTTPMEDTSKLALFQEKQTPEMLVQAI